MAYNSCEVSSRINMLREELLKTKPEVCPDRAKLVTESYYETIGRPYIIRRAKALEKTLLNMEIFIRNGELVVGNLAETLYGAPVFPEYDTGFLEDEIDTISTRKADPFSISKDCKDTLRQILPKWKSNTIKDQALKLFSNEQKQTAKDLIFVLTALGSGVGHMIVDYEYGIKKGLLYIKEEALDFLNNLEIEDPTYTAKKNYYIAAMMVCDAVISFAKRFEKLASEKANKEKDLQRKKELLAIAENCKRVPSLPARNFWEAIQSFWFIHIALQLESNGHSVSPGRFDQYMYSFYEQEKKKEGDFSKSFSEELLQSLWIKFNEINKVRDKVSSVAFGGYPMYQNLMVGGQTCEGKSAINELSYLCMETTEKIAMPQPSLSVRLFAGCPDSFLQRACKVASCGMGMPAFFNDEVLIPIMLGGGYDISEARDYAIVGCVEPTVPSISEPWLTGGFINLAKFLELTIFNGYDPVFGKQREFITGDVEDFKSFSEFKEAFFKQMAYYIKVHVSCDNILEGVHGMLCPTPFESVLTRDCMKKGKTTLEGGAKHNTITINAVGFANAADGFTAVKRLIYDEKLITWKELKKAMLMDFEGYEDIRQLLLNKAPKFGNDEQEVDELAREIHVKFNQEICKYKNVRGGNYSSALYSIACHVLLADKVGATPDGRKGSMLLADGGVSCAQGRDINGPTALMNSIVKLDHKLSGGGALFNMKFNPSIFKGEDNLKSVSDMVKAFFMRKAQHVQFNVVDKQMLLDAQKSPEDYPNLVVRVAGFSVRFITLDKMTQNDIISRTEHKSF